VTILNRYLTRLFCVMLGITIPGLTGIYLLVHFIEHVDEFIDSGTNIWITAEYFILLIPGLVYELAPLAILLGALLSTMIITKNMEMLALRSCGISPRTIARPFFTTAGILSLSLLLLYAFVIPQANSQAAAIKATTTTHRSTGGTLIGSRLFFKGPHSIIKAEVTRPDATELKNIHWYFFNPDYSLKEMIAAEKAVFTHGKWHFSQGMTYGKDTGHRAFFFKELERKLPASPNDFRAVRKPAEQMDLVSLASTVHHMRMEGLPCGELETRLWGQILYPFLSILLLMVGLPITISRIKGAISMSFGLAMAIGLGTWVLWNLAMALGQSGAVPGFLAPIMVETAIAGTGIYVMRITGFYS